MESAEGEDAAQQGPEVGNVGDEDGGGGLADVPVEVDEGAETGREVVVAVQDRAEDDEEAEGEDAAEDDFTFERQAGADEDGEGDVNHHEVGGDVEDGGGDQVVVVRCALRCLEKVVSICVVLFRKRKGWVCFKLSELTIVDRDLPVLFEWPAPDPKE